MKLHLLRFELRATRSRGAPRSGGGPALGQCGAPGLQCDEGGLDAKVGLLPARDEEKRCGRQGRRKRQGPSMESKLQLLGRPALYCTGVALVLHGIKNKKHKGPGNFPVESPITPTDGRSDFFWTPRRRAAAASSRADVLWLGELERMAREGWGKVWFYTPGATKGWCSVPKSLSEWMFWAPP